MPQAQRIQIFLKHYADPEGRFTPRTRTCEDYETPTGVRKGCGATITRYMTYPREKGMYFDGDPVVIERFPVREDGAVIALVDTANVHFATCKARKVQPPTRDFRAAAAGGG